MRSRRVVLDISPSRLELTLVGAGGCVIASQVHDLSGDLLDEWPSGLDRLAPDLRAWIAKHQLLNAPTTILYTSPDAHAGVFTVPRSIGGGPALQAGTLALADAVAFPLELNPHGVQALPCHPGDRAVPDAQLHLLGVADADASTAAVYSLASGVGLRVESIIPSTAALIASTVRAAAEVSDLGCTLLLHLGEHTSVLAAVSGGRLRFIRTFAVGIDAFVDVLRRPLASRSPSGSTVTLDRASARAMLLAAGVPRREDVIDERLGIDGAAILPLLQPVLQRCAVEVKQSLRFGLGEAERSEIRLRLLGLGPAFPRFGEAIAELHGAPLTCEQANDLCDASRGAAHGATAAYLASGPLTVSLLPGHIRSTRGARGFARATCAGLAVAAALVVTDGVFTHLSLRAETAGAIAATAAAPVPAAAVDDPALRLYEQTVAARSGVAGALVRMESALGGAPDWSAVLAMLSETTPRAIRIRGIDLLDEPGGGLTCRVRAAASPIGGESPAVIIKQYLDTIRAVPLVGDVRLGATGRTLVDGEAVHEFELFCDLVPLPARHGLGSAATVTSAETGP